MPGFELDELLHNSSSSAVYRARDTANGRRFVIKCPQSDLVSARQLTRYQNEYEILKSIQSDGVIKVHELVRHKGQLALVLEAFDGISLRQWIRDSNPGLVERLKTAVQIAHTIGAVHAAGVIHKDINSHNILVDPANGRTTLIDFGIATRLRSEQSRFQYPAALEGTLDYIAPEQTGRVNRSLDYRADWYSFGVTLYELLSDRLPLETADPLEAVHFHIAVQPPRLSETTAEIPEAVADVVAKLLRKAPEDRYQSAVGLIHDLNLCIEKLEAEEPIDPFALGSHDVYDRFELPQRLYGREEELNELITAFERVARGSAEAMLIAGSPGIGKTSLVGEIYRPIAERHGYIVSGKYEQLKQDSPFNALVEALQDLVSQLLTESDESVARWREAIQGAVGVNGRVITDVIPMLEHVIGMQPDVMRLSGVEAENRFKLVFKHFVQVFAKRSHPLVILLDDMQWSDSASLNLVTMLLTAPEMESLFIVQAYRDSEVDSGHQFSLAVGEQEKLGVHIGSIELGPLTLENVRTLVEDAMRQVGDQSTSLARIVHEKTGGNPFFVLQFLQSLHADGVIAFDERRGCFSCNSDAVEATSVTDNVADLLTAKLEKLPPPTSKALSFAAAIGRHFDLAPLAPLMQRSEAEIAELLRPALIDGLIVPLSDLESLDPERSGSTLGYRRLKFLHDRVQRAAYDLIDESERPAIHLSIGRVRLEEIDDEQRDRRLFDVVNHLNHGIDLIDDENERRRLATLNLTAAVKSQSSTAYALAARCYERALQLQAGDHAWGEQSVVALKAHIGLAEVLTLTAEPERAFVTIENALCQARSLSDRATLHALKVNAFLSTGQMPEALDCGRDAARALGVDLPTDPQSIQQALQTAIAMILERTGEIGIEKIVDLPTMHSEDEIALMALLTNCLPAAYQTDQQLFALMCCTMVSRSLEHGNCALSARAYGSFGALLSGVLGMHAEGHRFTTLAVDVAHRLDDPTVYAGVHFLIAMFTSHWVEPVAKSIELFKQSVDYGLQYGDHVHAAYSAARCFSHEQFRGTELRSLYEQGKTTCALLESIGDMTNLEFLEPRMRYIDWLSGNRPQGNTLGSQTMSEQAVTAAIHERGNKSFESDWIMLLERQRYLAGDLTQALEFGHEAERLIAFSSGFVTQVEHSFYYALIAARLHDACDSGRARELEALVESQVEKLRKWAESAASNYKHMYLLAAAEINRIRGETLEAMRLYDESIAEATNEGFVHIEALGAELAARFWRSLKKSDFASVYLNKALEAYTIWSAHGKADDLRNEFGLRPGHEQSQTHTSGSATAGGTTDYGESLDLSTALKASQAIAGEIRLDHLIEKMMGIVLENAGAEHGVLVIETDGDFLVQGVRSSAAVETKTMLGEPLSEAESLSRGVVNYVMRTSEHVVLTDPVLRGRFSKDPYVARKKPKSVLCAPIVYKGKLTGVIYLENNQVAGAFTPNRLEALNMLMSQIAASIDNATLYSKLKQQSRSIEIANTALAKEVRERKSAERELSRYKDHLEDLVAQRTRELESAQGRLVEVSRRAGMAEVAAGVLHNVGNVMNSVNVGAHVIRDRVKGLRLEQLGKVTAQISGQLECIGEYLSLDPAGKKIPEYLVKLSGALATDKQRIQAELDQLLEHLDHMKSVIAAQQSYAKTTGISEVCSIEDIVDTALAISEAALKNASIAVATEFAGVEPVLLDRHQVLQILINLISNAKHAVQENHVGNRRISITTVQLDGCFTLEISDNGIGIAAENFPMIFNHGFTTKKTGHGFGLHNCANAAREMDGSLVAHSDGPGAGARFVLTLPAKPAEQQSIQPGAA